MRYLPSLLRVQILSNDGICLGANINKFDQMWYLLHICIDFAVVVNPFFRAVSGAPNDGFLLNASKTLFKLSRVLLDLYKCIPALVSVRPS